MRSLIAELYHYRSLVLILEINLFRLDIEGWTKMVQGQHTSPTPEVNVDGGCGSFEIMLQRDTFRALSKLADRLVQEVKPFATGAASRSTAAPPPKPPKPKQGSSEIQQKFRKLLVLNQSVAAFEHAGKMKKSHTSRTSMCISISNLGLVIFKNTFLDRKCKHFFFMIF